MASGGSPRSAGLDLPTPPASSAPPSQHASPLPEPRKHPLKPGGPRESELIRYLDHGMNQIQKRIDNRTTNHSVSTVPSEEVEGYSAFWQVAKHLEGLMDVVWVSGSPNLQLPYLQNMAVLTADYLPLFEASARSTQAMFRIISKLDYALSSLLTGHDAATGEPLSGFERGRKVSTTDKVRLKGIVDRTRLTVVRFASGNSVDEKDDDDDDDANCEPMDTDRGAEPGALTVMHQGTVVFEGFENNEGDDDEDEEEHIWKERNVASVYTKTIGELGDVLGGPPIGIITDD